MIWEDATLARNLFDGFDLEAHLVSQGIHSLVDVKLSEYGDPNIKKVKGPNESVDPNLEEPFVPELDDLTRLHWLVTSRNVVTVLEFGVGKSTVIFDHALAVNRELHGDYVSNNLRKGNPYECHSIDNSAAWIRTVQDLYNLSTVTFYECSLIMGEFNGRVCTFYDPLPNVAPDFIYLDGPDQFSVDGSVRGISTNHPDRMPMAADILVFEHFLTPGTLIVADGRTANARFLKANLQRDWAYHHDASGDQHYFELLEPPLGIYNKRQLDFALGPAYFERLGKLQRS